MFGWLKKLFGWTTTKKTVTSWQKTEVRQSGGRAKVTVDGKVVYDGDEANLPQPYKDQLAETNRQLAEAEQQLKDMFK